MATNRAREIDLEMRRLVRADLASDLRKAELLAELERDGLYRQFAASMREYTETMLGLRRGKGGALMRIGRQLPHLPVLRAAMADGSVTWTAAREVVKVADPQTESGWVMYAQGQTVRQLERAVMCAERGDDAPAPGEVLGAPKRDNLRVEGERVNLALFRKAMAIVRAMLGDTDGHVEDDVVLALIAEIVFAVQSNGPRPITIERFQTILAKCPQCRDAVQIGLAEEPHAEVSASKVAAAECDSVIVDMRPGPDQGKTTHAIPERVRRVVLHRDNHGCVVPGCSHQIWVQLHHVVPRQHGGKHNPDNLMTVCSRHHDMIHDGDLEVERAANGSFAFEWRFGRPRISTAA